MRYLDGEEILTIHNELIEETGGAHGMRDIGLFLSAIERPKMSYGGKELYKTVHEKAAVYFESFAKHHVFIDGNKRTALVSAARFLSVNGYDLTASNREAEDFTLRVVTQKLEVPAIAAWLRRHSRKTRK